MSKTKFSLSKTGCNWVAVPTGSISKNQSVSRQKIKNAVSASKDASFGMSNSKISQYLIIVCKELITDMSRIGLSIDDYDGSPLSIFHIAALVEDCRYKFIYSELDNKISRFKLVHD